MLTHGFGFYLYFQIKYTFTQLRLPSYGVIAYVFCFFAEYIAIIKITNKIAVSLHILLKLTSLQVSLKVFHLDFFHLYLCDSVVIMVVILFSLLLLLSGA